MTNQHSKPLITMYTQQQHQRKEVAEISFLSHQVLPNDVVRGGHYYIRINGFVYGHHGLCVAMGDIRKSLVISETMADGTKITTSGVLIHKSVDLSADDDTLVIVNQRQVGLEVTTVAQFHGEYKLRVVAYEQKPTLAYHIKCQTSPGIANEYTPDHIDVIVERARKVLDNPDLLQMKQSYSLWASNCEQFAMYCTTGRPQSVQMDTWANRIRHLSQTAMPVMVSATTKVGSRLGAAAGIELAYHTARFVNYARLHGDEHRTSQHVKGGWAISGTTYMKKVATCVASNGAGSMAATAAVTALAAPCAVGVVAGMVAFSAASLSTRFIVKKVIGN